VQASRGPRLDDLQCRDLLAARLACAPALRKVRLEPDSSKRCRGAAPNARADSALAFAQPAAIYARTIDPRGVVMKSHSERSFEDAVEPAGMISGGDQGFGQQHQALTPSMPDVSSTANNPMM